MHRTDQIIARLADATLRAGGPWFFSYVSVLRSFVLAWIVGICVPVHAVTNDENDGISNESENETALLDYWKDVQPILKQRCFRCHGEKKQKGDLRLDKREFVEQGGHTGNTIVAGTLQKSELYVRISTDDELIRMPKSDEPLSAQELNILALWIQQGAKYSGPPSEESGPIDDRTFWEKISIWTKECEKRVMQPIRPALYSFLGFLVVILVVERCKTQYRNQRPWTQGRWSGTFRFLTKFHLSHYAIVTLGIVLFGFVLFHRASEKSLQSTIVDLNEKLRLPEYGNPGDMPKLVFPQHPKRLSGEYYRGNDERNPKLFNNGFYRTATFRIMLCDGDQIPIETGDTVLPKDLFVRFEIERAVKATKHLFTKDIMAKVFLSQQVVKDPLLDVLDEPVPMTTVEEDDLWQAMYPIDVPTDAGSRTTRSGKIYVYRGSVVAGKVGGIPHYAIQYDLVFEDGRLSAESEMTMGSMYHTRNVLIMQKHQIGLNEWFDFRPIPEIEGENTDDLKLLGVPEHKPKAKVSPAKDANGKDAMP